jgi:hypothetical protein
MLFPETIPKSEMDTTLKEWELAGVGIYKHTGKNAQDYAVNVNDESKREYYVYELIGDTYRRVGADTYIRRFMNFLKVQKEQE